MIDSIERLRSVVTQDVDPEFLRTCGIDLAWRYSQLFERLQASHELDVTLKEEEFYRQRGYCATEALAFAAQKHKVPFRFKRLECNGQRKLLVKAGRVIIIQEPMLTRDAAPRASDYKRQLADATGLIRQLELDFGDRPGGVADWSGEVLATLLHGDQGAGFERDNKSLGGLMLGVPDAGYSIWALRLDLEQVALHGTWAVPGAAGDQPGRDESTQPDRVIVRVRRRRSDAGEGA